MRWSLGWQSCRWPWSSASTRWSPWWWWVWRMLCADASRRFDEAHNEIRGLVNGRTNRFALLRTKRPQHVVGRVHVAGRPADPDAEPSERARAEAGHDVAQAVVPAVAATLPISNLAKSQVQIVVDDEQAVGGRSPAFDRLQGQQPAVVHEPGRKHEPRAAHRDRHQSRRGPQPETRDCLSHRARADVVPSELILPLGVAQPDNHSRRWIARCQAIGRHTEKLPAIGRQPWPFNSAQPAWSNRLGATPGRKTRPLSSGREGDGRVRCEGSLSV